MFIRNMADLFSFFRSKQLKPAWEFNTDALIWRIFFTSANTIVGETRNQTTKSTTFFCVDSFTGKPLWKNVGFDEPWWIGIETVHDQRLVLHGYARPDMPEHRGIQLVDIESGKLLWKNDTLSFWFVQKGKLYAHKYLFEKRIGYELDINTGIVLNEYTDNLDVLHELRQRVLQDESNEQHGIIFPELFDSHQEASSIDTAIQRITDGKALEGWIEYLTCQGILFVSYYRQEPSFSSPSLNNIFTVYDIGSEKTLFKEIIVEDLKTPSPDTFFIKDEFAYFIKNQDYINSVAAMEVITEHIKVSTHGNSEVVDITEKVIAVLQRHQLQEGQVTLFVVGSTASITTTEYEPGLRKDIPEMLERIAPSSIRYHHDDTWGDGNGHAHVRASFLGPSLIVPFTRRKAHAWHMAANCVDRF